MLLNPSWHHAAIVLGMWGSSILVTLLLISRADIVMHEMELLHDPVHFDSTGCVAHCKVLPTATAEACSRIGEQTGVILGRIKFYYAAMTTYTVAQFAFVMVGYVTGILTAVFGVMVSRSGWGDCDKRLLTAFIASAAATAFYEGLPSLVKFQTNINQNSDTFLYYDDLLDEVETFCSVGMAKDGTTDAPSFVIYVDRRMAELNELYFEIDESKMGSGGKSFVESQDMEKYKPEKKEVEATAVPPVE